MHRVENRKRGRAQRPLRAQDGFILVLTALLLLPLLAFTGLAVDLGSWLGRAAQIQKAADAAALAGVAYLPDTGRADRAAREVATANGFTDGTDGISVSVTPVSGNSAQLRVTITDAGADQYFTEPFTGGAVDITRASTAEYIKPVPMGSPKNFLGTGGLLSGSNRENFFLAVSGGCSSKEQGDRIMTQTDANFTTTNNPPTGSNGWNRCTGSTTIVNQSYDPNGYFYAVEFAQDYAGSVRLQVYDAPYCTSGGAGDSTGAFTTRFTVRDNTSFNPLNTGVINSRVFSPSDCGSWGGRWETLHTLVNPTAGTYFIQVQGQSQAEAGSQDQMGSNSFGLRALETRYGGSFQPCTSDPSQSGSRVDCPNVYGVNNMGILAALAGTTPSFYLAEIGPEHNNKTMEISLWDPGEGSLELEVLDPTGDPATFRWEVLCQDGSSAPCAGEIAPNGGYGPQVDDELDLGNPSSDYPQPGPHRVSTSKYSDRLLKLTIELPTDITAAYGGLTWWRIRYTVGSAPTDRTTWAVAVKGDPVRLIPND
ncbi:pilus assembly protein TadG-related protein [Rhabdothermincola salaria]|uniref:pilus assembly protein TadG-related protein n=1 Tax=Rhabdothermincola salaria TaxID=2903142 RepID=UPI001E463D1B|nr:pilus assembly protein TadG-related protein [Rhabdothermincola salaria]